VQHKIVGEILYATLIYQDQIRVSDKCDNTAVYSNSQYDGPEMKANMWWLRSQLADRCGTYILGLAIYQIGGKGPST